MARTAKKPADYIKPLYMNGLEGRVLHIPAPQNKNKEILFVYGHHSSLERWWGVAQELNRYGAVTVPDLPGFGGMDSFYKIGLTPTVDNMADYLAAFVKLRYKRKKVAIAGLSFGFVIVTRMLQRYPDLTKRVSLVVSVVGFTHSDDFKLSGPRHFCYHRLARLFSARYPALFFRNIFLQPWVLRAAYGRTRNARQRFTKLKPDEWRTMMDFEIYLWRCNDVRTYMMTAAEFLTLNNCKVRVGLPVWHVTVNDDHYFDTDMVEQHLGVVFSECHTVKSRMKGHGPSIIADAKQAAPLIPTKIRRLLDEQ